MQQIKDWFYGLDDNEQKIVIGFSVVIGFVILFFGIIFPINNQVSLLQKQVESREKSVANWTEKLPLVLANRNNPSATTSKVPLTNVITSTSSRFRLRVSRVQEKSESEIQVWLDNVNFNDFIKWVDELESNNRINVSSANIRNKDRNGLSSIDIKLVRR